MKAIEEAEQAMDGENTACYDVIAMATPGRGGLRRLVMGSVTEHVLGTTKFPPLIVRPRKAEIKDKGSGDTWQVEVTES